MTDRIRKYKMRRLRRRLDRLQRNDADYPMIPEEHLKWVTMGEGGSQHHVPVDDRTGQVGGPVGEKYGGELHVDPKKSISLQKLRAERESYSDSYYRSFVSNKVVGGGKPKNKFGFGGYFDENEKNTHFTALSPSPSVLSMVSPRVLQHINNALDSQEDSGTKKCFAEAINTVRIWRNYLGPGDGFDHFNPRKNFVELSKMVAEGDDMDVYSQMGETFAHEALHFLDFGMSPIRLKVTYKKEEVFEGHFSYTPYESYPSFSSLYEHGAFVKSIKDETALFLKSFGFGKDDDYDVREKIKDYYAQLGITERLLGPLSDILNAGSGGAFTLNCGHGEDYFCGEDETQNDINIATESYADMGACIYLSPLAFQAICLAVPKSVDLFFEMNDAMSKRLKNHLTTSFETGNTKGRKKYKIKR